MWPLKMTDASMTALNLKWFRSSRECVDCKLCTNFLKNINAANANKWNVEFKFSSAKWGLVNWRLRHRAQYVSSTFQAALTSLLFMVVTCTAVRRYVSLKAAVVAGQVVPCCCHFALMSRRRFNVLLCVSLAVFCSSADFSLCVCLHVAHVCCDHLKPFVCCWTSEDVFSPLIC